MAMPMTKAEDQPGLTTTQEIESKIAKFFARAMECMGCKLSLSNKRIVEVFYTYRHIRRPDCPNNINGAVYNALREEQAIINCG